VSEPGNLFTTLLMRVPGSAEQCAQLSFAAALAVGDTVAALAPQAHVALKWPNDVLLEARKVAGILLEAASTKDGCADWVLIGIGINLSHFPENVEFPAISVAAVTGAAPERDDALSVLGSHWNRWFEAWREGGFEPLRQAWLARAAGLGDKIVAKAGARQIEGVFQDLDGDGALLIREVRGGISRVTAGEVFFRP
jgi:BirA family biotin operon repressor/biotin-[acetyl-CoA-carboxylase] ligase